MDKTLALFKTFVAPNGFLRAVVPLRNFSHSFTFHPLNCFN